MRISDEPWTWRHTFLFPFLLPTNVRGRVFGSHGKAGCGAGAGWRFDYKVLLVRRWKNWLMRPITAFSYPDLTHALKSLVSKNVFVSCQHHPLTHAHMRRKKKKYSQFQLVGTNEVLAGLRLWEHTDECLQGESPLGCLVVPFMGTRLHLGSMRDVPWGKVGHRSVSV